MSVFLGHRSWRPFQVYQKAKASIYYSIAAILISTMVEKIKICENDKVNKLLNETI